MFSTTYKLSSLESAVKSLYIYLGIQEPPQINVHSIAEKLNIHLLFLSMNSKLLKRNGQYYMVIDKRLTPQEQRQDFCHEIAHILLHSWYSEIWKFGGNQLYVKESFVEYQEMKADNYAYEFCVPTFMLLTLTLPELKRVAATYIAEQFYVTNEFAYERLNRFVQRMVQY